MDRELRVAYGSSRNALIWSNRITTFRALCERLRTPIRTPESMAEYAQLSRAERDSIKDKGGLVGGELRDGRRKADHVSCRSMGTADIDSPSGGFLEHYREKHSFASVIYTTHSSTPRDRRYRCFTPFTRDVSCEEYVAIMRHLANEEYGIEAVDPCSYSVNQLMYWPNAAEDGEYICEVFDGDWLDPDVFLAAHPGWEDVSTLPASVKERALCRREQKRQRDPLQKDGVIGAFNNVFFPISKLLDTVLCDIYEPTAIEGRYTHIGSSGVAGAVVYDDRFLYSHHATDPAYGRLLNAFDLMRVQLFGDMDEAEGMKQALRYAAETPEVKAYLSARRAEEMRGEFDAAIAEEDDWRKLLKYDPRKGTLVNCLFNIKLIMQNDPYMKSIVFNQLADNMEIKGEVPWAHPAKFWRDADDAQLMCYVDDTYGTFSKMNYDIAVTKAVDDRSYHPIREYFAALPPWDGVPRVDTALIDYLGAADNAYVRAVTRKVLCAAYCRIYEPGIKYDYMLVLNGDQGIGKSTFIERLGMEWFSDSLSLSDMNDKTAAEKLQGYWIMEIGELAGMKKADLDKVKAFISRRDDKYRASFGRRVAPHPRQCVFIGTTNNKDGYLRDITGNRRYWNVRVSGEGIHKPWELSSEIVQQIWAETVVLVKAGEKLFLPPELEEIAKDEQREAMERDDREGIVEDFLEMLLPDGWENMDAEKRRDYICFPGDPNRPKGIHRRTEVSNIEIWCECFGKRKEDMRPSDSYAISAVMARLGGWSKPVTRRYLPSYGRQRVYQRL